MFEIFIEIYTFVWDMRDLIKFLCIFTFILSFLMIAESRHVVAEEDDAVLFCEDFETWKEGGLAEGWSIYGGIVEVSDRYSSSGNRSIKVEDPDNTRGAGVRTGHMPIEEGMFYIAMAESYRESGDAQIYLEFWNEYGVRIGVTIGNSTIKGEWQRIVISGQAPEGAKTATILLYSHTSNIGTAYYDDVILAKVEKVPESIFQKSKEIFVPKYSGKHTAIINEHPRVYFTKDDEARLKKTGFARPNYVGERGFTVEYYGGKRVTYRLPPVQPKPMAPPPGFTAGDYPYWTIMSRQIQSRMEDLCLSYVVTGQKKFADTAIKYALALTDWDTWNEFGYTSLSVAHLTFGMVSVYDMLYHQLTPAQRVKIRDSVIEKAIIPISAVASSKADHNIQVLGNTAMGLAALSFLDEAEGMDRYIQIIKDWCLWYLDERLVSGKTEALMYTSYAVDYIIRFADSLYRITGDDDLLEHPYIRDELVQWTIYSLAPGFKEHVPFSDSSLRPYFDVTMKVLSNIYGNGYAGWYLLKADKTSLSTFEGAIYGSRQFPVASPDEWPTSKAFNIGWALLRSGWGDDDTFLALLSSSSNVGHNHMDQNHFVLNVAGDWLITDPGYQDYSPGPKNEITHGTVGHNCILFDDQGQSLKGGGVMVGFLASPTFDYVAGDATAAYSNLMLRKWRRDILYLKPGYFLFFDQVDTGLQERKVELLIRPDKAASILIDDKSVKLGRSVAAEKIGIHKIKGSATVKYIWPKALNMTYDVYKGAEEYGPYIRIWPEEKVTCQTFVSMITTEVNGSLKLNTKGAQPADVDLDEGDGRISLVVHGATSTDYVLHNSKGKTMEDANISTDGRYGIMSLNEDDINRFALIDGKALGSLKNNQILVQAEEPISMAFGYEKNGWSGTIESKGNFKVKFYVPRFTAVYKDGEALSTGDYSYDGKDNLITVVVKQGTNRFQFRH